MKDMVDHLSTICTNIRRRYALGLKTGGNTSIIPKTHANRPTQTAKNIRQFYSIELETLSRNEVD